MDKTTLLVVDDHPVVRHGLRGSLAAEEDIEIVGEAVDGDEAVEKTVGLAPDVVLMDLVMPGGGGLQALRRIRELSPNTKVLVLTSFADEDKVLPAIQAGAAGYLIKDIAPVELAKAIRQVRRGEAVLNGQVAKKLMEQVTRPPLDPKLDRLTSRERDTLELIARGYTNREIAEELVVSEKTVKTHVSNILSKLDMAHRTEAACYALTQASGGTGTLPELLSRSLPRVEKLHR